MSNSPDLRLEDLPSLAQDIVRALDDDMAAAWEVVSAWGGARLAIPEPDTVKSQGAGHPLAVKVGLERAVQLAIYFDGETIDVPRCVRALEILRDKEIISDYGQPGVTAETLALKYRCTRRTIFRRLERNRRKTKQQVDERQGVLCFD